MASSSVHAVRTNRVRSFHQLQHLLDEMPNERPAQMRQHTDFYNMHKRILLRIVLSNVLNRVDLID